MKMELKEILEQQIKQAEEQLKQKEQEYYIIQGIIRGAKAALEEIKKKKK